MRFKGTRWRWTSCVYLPLRTWRLYSLIMIRIHADLVAFLGEGVLAMLDRPQLVVRLQVRPTPEPTVNHVRETFAADTLNAVVADAARTRPVKNLQM